MEKCWLKPNVCSEPLVSNWYAWSHLISPITASEHLSKRYLQILRSYIQHPELHVNANKDPHLIGGPYINLPTIEVEKIEEFYNSLLLTNQPLLDLAEAIDQLSLILEESANGISLESIYGDIPDLLAGCVELVYDMSNHASIRFIEPLVYNKFYNTKNQSIALSLVNADDRPFVLSTPYLASAQKVHLNMPFSDNNIDLLYKAKREPCDINALAAKLHVTEHQLQQFSTYFTKTPPANIYKKYDSDNLRIRYFGHACILIETKNTSILIDPLISYPNLTEPDRFSYYDLPERIDYVLITHNHQDHFDLETLLQIRHQIDHIVVPSNNNGFLADPSLKLILEHLGFKNIITLDEFEKIIFSDGQITSIPFLGEHGDLNIQSKSAYHIKINKKSLFFAVDSNNLDENLYRHIAKYIGPIDSLFIGMECAGAPCSWTYGPLFHKKLKYDFDQSRRLNGSDSNKAWQMIDILKCKEVNVYAMGQEPWLHHIMGLVYAEDSIQLREVNALLQKCKEASIIAEKPYGKKEWIYAC